MLKASSFFFIALTCYCISCKPKDGRPSEKIQKNIDAMNGVGKAFETRDFSKLGDYIADDAIDHAGEQGDVHGLPNIKAAYQQMASATEDVKMETIKQLADDDYGVTWIQHSGKMKADNMGMKAGQKYEMKSMEVVKFRDGKIVEHWVYMDPAEMMEMMMPSQMPAPSQMPMHKDSMQKDTMINK